jgi:hypothetical protein
MNQNNSDKTASNEHIGSMAALPPLERAVRNASLSPAGKCSEAATAPICHHVINNGITANRCRTKHPERTIIHIPFLENLQPIFLPFM